MDRRGFLTSLAAVTGGAAISPVAAMAASDGARAKGGLAPRRATRVGVLLPSGASRAGESFLEGARLASAGKGDPGIEVLAEAVPGAGWMAAQEPARRLLEEGRADVLVGPISCIQAAALRPLLEKARTPLLLADAGARALAASEESPWIFRCSAGLWQSSLALGAHAAEKIGRRAVVVSSLYDAGFDHLFAFELGFHAAGGRVLATRVLGAPARPISVEAVLAEIAEQAPDVVHAALSGDEAVAFVAAYARAGLTARIPLVGASFLLEERNLAVLGKAALGIRACAAWAPSLETPANQAFTAAFEARARRAPDAFALLGYEAAHLASEAMRAASTDASASLADALGAVVTTGPRGRVRVDAATRSAEGPCYLLEVQERRGRAVGAVVGEVAAVGAHDPRADVLRTGLKTGWLNSYLC